MTLFDYKVSFPFGATSAPYSPTHPHSGEDRAAPSGTPIVVSGVQLGVVGATGQATGPHTHIQKAVNGVFVSPNGGGGNVTGNVTEVGYNTEIGNFVRIVDANGVRWSYFHMRDVPLVKVGQVIGEIMATPKEVDDTIAAMHESAFGTFPSDDVFKDRRNLFEKVGYVAAVLQTESEYNAHPDALKNKPQGNFVPVTEQLYKKG